MDNCDELIEGFRSQAEDQVALAVAADAPAVAAMHLDLAVFLHDQVHQAEEYCEPD